MTTLLTEGRDRSRGAGHRIGWLWTPRALAVVAASSGALSAAFVASLASGERSVDPARYDPARNAAAPVRDRGGPDVASAARDVDDLARTLARPHPSLAESFGAHRVFDRSELALRSGGAERESLAVTRDITFANTTRFSAQSDNSAGYSRHIVAKDGALYTRSGDGPVHERPPERAGEVRELAEEVTSAPNAYIGALLPGAAIARTREIDRDDREALAIALEKGAPGAESEIDGVSDARAEIEDVGGELVLDAETGALLSADVSGSLRLLRGSREFALDLAFSRELEILAAPPTLDVPGGEKVVTAVDGRRAPLRPSHPDGGRRDRGE